MDTLPERLQAGQAELAERIARDLREDGVSEPLKGVFFARLSSPMDKVHSVQEPSFCVIAQGSKEIYVGGARYLYDPNHYFLTTLELPRVSRVLEATCERPYLSFRLELDPHLVSEVLVEAGPAATQSTGSVRALDVSPLDADLLDAVVRLARLADKPAEAPVLMPLVVREIITRLLLGAQGNRLRHLAAGSHAPHIVRAIQRIREDYDRPLRIEQLAYDLGMSVSGFHHHFKAVTAMSPLQFQKQLRLQEARRLMLVEHVDATGAAYRVGYNDASHFSREYKSMFGVPPMRDVQRLHHEERVPNTV